MNRLKSTVGKIVAVGAFASVAEGGCALTAPEVAPHFCMATVSSFSNPDAGARGDFSENVRFADLSLNDNSVGYGAAGERSDEITIADGIIHLAHPTEGGGYSERTTFASGEGGYMVQLVSPKRWRAPIAMEKVATLDDLGVAIGKAAGSGGCIGPTKLAYRITARIDRADWSLDTLPQRGDFTTVGQEAVIVGLYANVDQKAHFVTAGRNIHAHIVFPKLGVAGHLKDVKFASGARLQLQAD